VRNMVWSYSRLKSFEDCKYRWFLKYIAREDADTELFFASFGKFVHGILSRIYAGEITEQEALMLYLTSFREEVVGKASSDKVYSSYLEDGKNAVLSPKRFCGSVVSVENRFALSVAGFPFIGFIDLLMEEDGEYIITDHKSRTLQKKSGRANPTKNDLLVDEFFRQLYLYAEAVYQKYGKYPKRLILNCFRNGVVIEEEFDKDKLKEAVSWATGIIEEIAKTEDFSPSLDYFRCQYLCEMRDKCEYYELSQR